MLFLIVTYLLITLSFFPAWLIALISALCLFLDALFIWRLIK